jgi:hypothetical protein
MDRPKLHVCIATGQNLPNLIAALQLGAKEVIVLETSEMRSGADNLKRALEDHDIEVKRLPFDDATPEAIASTAEKVAQQVGERPLVFNVTGGHKLMTLALAREIAVADELHLLYVETRHDRLDWLKPEAETEPMEDMLNLDDLLCVQGYRITSRGRRDGHWMHDAEARAPLTRYLGDRADALKGFFGVLNELANLALEKEPRGPFRPRQELNYVPGGADAKVLRDAAVHRLLNWDRKREIVFSSEQAARYFRGGWLEEYAYLKLGGLKPKDWDVNVTIESTQGRVENEFDALVAHRNRLLVVECKTSRFGRDGLKDAGYVYKLAQLSRSVGGIMSRSLLLSARGVDPGLWQRANENGVDVLAGAAMKGLVTYLRGWMGR